VHRAAADCRQRPAAASQQTHAASTWVRLRQGYVRQRAW
jgi:hypothetical protein